MARIGFLLSTIVLATLLLVQQPHSQAQSSTSTRDDEKPIRRPVPLKQVDFEALKKIYGNTEVTIVTEDGKGAYSRVRITGVDELFGKLFLRLETPKSNTILTRADRIIAIEVWTE